MRPDGTMRWTSAFLWAVAASFIALAALNLSSPARSVVVVAFAAAVATALAAAARYLGSPIRAEASEVPMNSPLSPTLARSLEAALWVLTYVPPYSHALWRRIPGAAAAAALCLFGVLAGRDWRGLGRALTASDNDSVGRSVMATCVGLIMCVAWSVGFVGS